MCSLLPSLDSSALPFLWGRPPWPMITADGSTQTGVKVLLLQLLPFCNLCVHSPCPARPSCDVSGVPPLSSRHPGHFTFRDSPAATGYHHDVKLWQVFKSMELNPYRRSNPEYSSHRGEGVPHRLSHTSPGNFSNNCN